MGIKNKHNHSPSRNFNKAEKGGGDLAHLRNRKQGRPVATKVKDV